MKNNANDFRLSAHSLLFDQFLNLLPNFMEHMKRIENMLDYHHCYEMT
jgi:hypothetical protein